MEAFLWLWVIRYSLIETVLLSQPHSLYVTQRQRVAYLYSKGLLRKLSSTNGIRTRNLHRDRVATYTDMMWHYNGSCRLTAEDDQTSFLQERLL